MCNYFYADKKAEERAARLLDLKLKTTDPGYGEKRPTDKIYVVFPDGAELCRWGLIPRWMKEAPKRPFTNARAETVTEKPSFRHLLESNRCIIPATHFFEWPGKKKTRIIKQDGEPMLFAGLWDEWKDPDSGKVIKSVTIITTAPNDFMQDLHDRMPLMLEPKEAKTWLKGTKAEAMSLIEIKTTQLRSEPTDGQQDLFD